MIAIAYDKEGWTYGPIYRTPAGSMAPSLKSPPSLKVVDEIERILRLSPPEYQAEEQRVFDHVQPHDIDRSMAQFLQLVDEVEPFKARKSQYLLNYMWWFVRKAMNRIVPENQRGHPPAPLYGGSPGVEATERAGR